MNDEVGPYPECGVESREVAGEAVMVVDAGKGFVEDAGSLVAVGRLDRPQLDRTAGGLEAWALVGAIWLVIVAPFSDSWKLVTSAGSGSD